MQNIDLIRLVEKEKVISIIGMTKNSGKTTTLNYIIENLKSSKLLGLTSVGRDGETKDLVTATKKPRIFVPKGTLIATAKECLFNGDITREILKTTSISTSMGEIVICRALSDGFVEIAGPSTNSYLENIKKELTTSKCELLIVDGALDRKTFAGSFRDEGIILATGAALSPDINKVVEDTIYTIKLLNLDKPDNESIVESALKVLDEKKCGVINRDGSSKSVECITTMEAARNIAQIICESTTSIILKGALTDKLLIELGKLIDLTKIKNIIVEDGTKVFLTQEVLNRFEKQGGTLRALYPLRVVAVTVNPESPYGYEFNRNLFLEKIKEKTPIPVFDVVGGEKY